MKTALVYPVIAVVLTAAALVVPVAEARTHSPSAPRTTSIQRVELRLRATRAALNQAAAELARMRNELESPHVSVQHLRMQTAQLHRTLTQTSMQLNASRKQLASLPTPLAVAVAQVRREVAYVQGGVYYSRGQLISQAATDYVVGHVSDTAYGYLETFGGVLPAENANSVLGAQAGICGHAAVAFATIVSRFGYPVRSVQFLYYDPGSPPIPDIHVGVEVFYDGGWHYFDPTYGQFWTDENGHVLSIGEVRSGLGALQKDVASFTNVFEDAVLGDDTWFETDPSTNVVIGGANLTG